MGLVITPQPSEAERKAIEAAIAADARGHTPSPWADRLLYGAVARALKSFGALRA
jgi:hypothetical protein